MKRRSITLQAGQPMPVQLGGAYFFLDVCPDGGLTVEFFSSSNVKNDEAIEAGVAGTEATPPGGFSSMIMTSVTLQTISYYVAKGGIRINRFSAAISSTVAPNGIAQTPAKKTATVASTQALAANGSRRYLLIQVPLAAPGSAFFRLDGGVAVADATSLELQPGQIWEPNVPPTGQINMIRGGAVDVDCHVIEG